MVAAVRLRRGTLTRGATIGEAVKPAAFLNSDKRRVSDNAKLAIVDVWWWWW